MLHVAAAHTVHGTCCLLVWCGFQVELGLACAYVALSTILFITTGLWVRNFSTLFDELTTDDQVAVDDDALSQVVILTTHSHTRLPM